MADRMAPTRLLSVVLAATVLAITGCAQVPVHGPVVAGANVGPEELGSVRIEAQAPRVGATPGQIAQGFLDAMSTFDVGFSLAKRFLTVAAAESWDVTPIVIYDSPVIDVGDDGSVLFSAQKVAEIDAQGQYTPANPGAPLQITMPMVNEGGELRISQPPAGVLITTLDRDNDYSPYVTYYPSSFDRVLVPDIVWLPGVGAGLATVLAQALVDGPTARLGDSVTNAFPEGSAVTAVSVRSGGIASVSLTGPIESAGPDELQTMAAQLAYTLRDLARGGVELTIEGVPLGIPGVTGRIDPGAFANRDPLLGRRDPAGYALMADRLVAIDPASGATTPVAGPLGDSAGGARSVAVNLDETLAATVSANGRTVATQHLGDDEEPLLQSFTGIDVAAPSWDRYGNLWAVDRTSELGSAVYVITPEGDGAATPIQAPALTTRRVLSFRIAPDGARAAVSVLTEDGSSRLLILRVVRGPGGITLSGVADPAALPGLESVGDLAWIGETEVAVVVTAPERTARAAIVRIDGSTISPEVETGVTAIAGYWQQALLAITNDDTLRRKESAITWATLGPATAVTYPG